VPIAGIAPEDLTVSVGTATEATGNGEKCTILSVGSDMPDVTGLYPSAGAVTAQILLERGGNQNPQGECLVTVHAAGWDGAGTTARGSQNVLVPAATIGASGLVAVPDITVRESQAVAGIDRDCSKWVRKQLKLRDKCNALTLKKGGTVASAKCRDAGPVPTGCDSGLHVEAILAMAHGMNDQQTDPAAGESVDRSLLKDQVNCQKRFGKAAVKFATKRITLIQKRCINPALDSPACRDDQSQTSRKALEQIDKCSADQMVDSATGRSVPDLGEPCDVCLGAGGTIDRVCLKACFQSALDQLSDGILGDVPVCGDGILQGGEFCDDGNLVDGDGCSSLCGNEVP
jgi:cysteine-rich repeat protein